MVLDIVDINQDTIIYDTENWHSDPDNINYKNGQFRFFGWYSYKDNKYYVTREINVIQEVINKFKLLVGFNNKEYDNNLLKRYGINFDYKIQLDLMQVLKPRDKFGKHRCGIIIRDGKSMFDTIDGYSMEKVAKWLKLDDLKQEDFNYNILEKEEYTEEELKYIYKYLKQDLVVTRKIFEFLENYFSTMRPFLSKKDQDKKEYIRATTAVYAYKVLCNYTGIKEEYTNGLKQDFKGAFVYQPKKNEYRGSIYCLDFASLYPHIFIQCNLFSRLTNSEDGWNGGGFWITQGVYDDKEQGIKSKVLQQ